MPGIDCVALGLDANKRTASTSVRPNYRTLSLRGLATPRYETCEKSWLAIHYANLRNAVTTASPITDVLTVWVFGDAISAVRSPPFKA